MWKGAWSDVKSIVSTIGTYLSVEPIILFSLSYTVISADVGQHL